MNHAKKSKNGNWVIPNSFQTPNFFVDTLMDYLTPYENVILVFAIRHILGFQENIANRQAHISLTRFSKCGLGQQGIRTALANLDAFLILIKTGEPTEEGQLYRLQEDENLIDWKALKERKEAKLKKNSKQTSKATEASLNGRGVTLDVRGYVERKGGVTSHVGKGLRQTSTIKPTSKPTSKPNIQSEMVGVLSDVTGLDYKIKTNAGRLAKRASELIKAKYAPEFIQEHYGSGGWWYKQDWRGRNGSPPTPEQVCETVGQIKIQQDEVFAEVYE